MGKKMKLLPSLLKNTEIKKSSSWPWPSCNQPKTLSFRANNNDNNIIFTPYLDSSTPMESFFTDDYSVLSFSTNASASASEDHSSIETVIDGLRSGDRLFFQAEETSSILESSSSKTAETKSLPAFKDSVVLSLDSQDPYVDFRKSMEEMVEAHGVKDWEGLEELLCWYLRVNGKSNHGYIVGAFVDLLLSLALASVSASASASASTSSSTSSSSYSPSSPLSFYSSSMSSSCSTRCVSCLEDEVVDNDTRTTTPSSSSSSASLLEQVKEQSKIHDEASSSSSSPN